MQPPPLSGAGAVYDPVLRMVMLAGGGPFYAGGNDGTWGWNGTTWRELDASISQPPVAGGTMAWDPALQQMVLVTAASPTNASSSQTWVWSDNRWIPKGTPAPFQAIALQIAFDESADTLVAVSCCDQASTNLGSTQTWRWDGSTWHLLGTNMIPSTPTFFGIGWDSITHSFLMCGQLVIGPQTPALMAVLTWKLVGRQWVPLRGAGPPVSDAVLIETDDGLRLIGADSTALGTSTPYHIWAWTGASWKKLG